MDHVASDQGNRQEFYSSVDREAIHTLWWAFICAGVPVLDKSMDGKKLIEAVRNNIQHR